MKTIDKLNNAKYTLALSARTSGATLAQNAQATKDMVQGLRGMCIEYTQATGVYNGAAEPSFITYPKDIKEVFYLLHLANLHNQECVLLVADGIASLVYADNTTTVIGTRWEQVALADTYELENYTYIDGHYFVVA